MSEVKSGDKRRKTVILSGPSHAEEVGEVCPRQLWRHLVISKRRNLFRIYSCHRNLELHQHGCCRSGAWRCLEKCNSIVCRNIGWFGFWGQYQGCAYDKRNNRNFKAGSFPWGKSPDFCRTYGYRRPYCDLYQHAQQKQACRNFDRSGKITAGSNG